jgi:hypothetical protein
MHLLAVSRPPPSARDRTPTTCQPTRVTDHRAARRAIAPSVTSSLRVSLVTLTRSGAPQLTSRVPIHGPRRATTGHSKAVAAAGSSAGTPHEATIPPRHDRKLLPPCSSSVQPQPGSLLSTRRHARKAGSAPTRTKLQYHLRGDVATSTLHRSVEAHENEIRDHLRVHFITGTFGLFEPRSNQSR